MCTWENRTKEAEAGVNVMGTEASVGIKMNNRVLLSWDTNMK